MRNPLACTPTSVATATTAYNEVDFPDIGTYNNNNNNHHGGGVRQRCINVVVVVSVSLVGRMVVRSVRRIIRNRITIAISDIPSRTLIYMTCERIL
jgi:hypothetical protein